jgi:N-acetylglucosaminyldiphosphoundecaprenol N-acetyl-beta-D-mannosaminyltransferase
MQRAGLEWLYRLIQEPHRLWRRYVHDLLYFGYFFLRQWWAMRQGALPAPLLPISETVIVDKTVILNIEGRMDIDTYSLVIERADKALQMSPCVVVNLARATFLDSTAMGALVALANRARAAGGSLRLAAVPPVIARTLALVRLDQFFEIFTDVETALDGTVSLIPMPQSV